MLELESSISTSIALDLLERSNEFTWVFLALKSKFEVTLRAGSSNVKPDFFKTDEKMAEF